ncbi:MAG TPA: TIGR01777 family oxidoreductase [Chitinophagaceae bacterium]|nr:TIGR01777 family oxidoreductase [Chitinophagaceae bacterium]
MATILITGGTGLIGTALSKLLQQRGYDVIILSRSVRPPADGIRYAAWNIEEQTIDIPAIQQADHIIHLAGANVAGKRWTKKYKQEIVESRTRSAALLVKALRENPNKVQSVLSSSGIGYYGNDNPQSKQRGFIETDPADEGFLGQTCVQWEQSIQPVQALGKRLVTFRTGIVLDNNGGALQEFRKPLHAGIAAILGSGKQIVSWIHIDDICRLYCHAIENTSLNGVYNAVAHQPVNNRTLVLELAKRMRGKFYIPLYVPAFALKLALGEMSIEVLKSANVSNEKIRHAGFKFLYPSLEAALNQLRNA